MLPLNQVSIWLNSLGMGRYAEAFSANEIEFESLADLDHETLRELGVTLVGHRLKILKAAAQLNAVDAVPDDARSTAGHATDAGGNPLVPEIDERRHLTVMFCDLVNSTELSARVDPEDLRRIVRQYQQIAAQQVRTFDGHIAQHLGDGLLVYFGYPLASEHAADQAVHSGLAICRAMKPLRKMVSTEYGFDLAVRIGIASGQVVIGDVGDSGHSETLALGETPNVAARLQSVAEPDSVVISESTHRLLNDSFELHALGGLLLKGLAARVVAYRVKSVSNGTSRFAIKHASMQIEMTGRSEELQLLQRTWQQVQGGEGQGVVLLGDPGLGKSVLVHQLLERVGAGAGQVILWQCSPSHSDSALHPVIHYLRGRVEADGSTGLREFVDRLGRELGLSPSSSPDVIARFGWLLGWYEIDLLPEALSAESAQIRRKEMLSALQAWIVRIAQNKPLLLVVEDAHWIDPTTLELLDKLVDSLHDQRLFLLITGRPEFKRIRRWDSALVMLSLNRLTRKAIARIAQRAANDKALPASVLKSILDRADGVPLFAEELTKAVVESGDLRETVDSWEIDHQFDEQQIPASLQGSLMARLEKASNAKRTAQVASCIGREFSYELLDLVSPASAAELDASLQSLEQAQIVIQRSPVDSREYFFRHALLRDSAYESMVRADRQKIHHLIADALDQADRWSDRVRPELIAQHRFRAGTLVEAAKMWRDAGSRALTRSENAEAVRHLSNAAQSLADGEEQSLDCDLELSVLSLLSGALISTRGYGSSEMASVIERSSRLIPHSNDPSLQFPAFYNRWVYETVWSRNAVARQVATEFRQVAKKLGAAAPANVALRLIGTSDFITGRLQAALGAFEEVVHCYDPDRDSELAYRFGQDPKASALAWGAASLCCVGKFSRAKSWFQRSIQQAVQVGHANTHAYVLYFGALLSTHLRGDLPSIEKYCDELAYFSEAKELRVWLVESRISRAWLNAHTDRDAALAATAVAREAIDEKESLGMLVCMPFTKSLLADVLARGGDISAAIDTASDAIQASVEFEEAWYRPELFRKRAQLFASTGEQDAALEDLHRAVDLADELNAAAWTFRAAFSLALLTNGQSQANVMLNRAIKDLPEDLAEPELSQARVILGRGAST